MGVGLITWPSASVTLTFTWWLLVILYPFYPLFFKGGLVYISSHLGAFDTSSASSCTASSESRKLELKLSRLSLPRKGASYIATASLLISCPARSQFSRPSSSRCVIDWRYSISIETICPFSCSTSMSNHSKVKLVKHYHYITDTMWLLMLRYWEINDLDSDWRQNRHGQNKIQRSNIFKRPY